MNPLSARRSALLLVAVAATLTVAFAACFDFSKDLETCHEGDGPCARFAADASASGSDGGDLGDGGGQVDAGPLVITYCESDSECRSGACVDGCCDSPCTGVARISAGDSLTCAAVTDGTVRCWGLNDQGQATGRIDPDGGTNVLIPTTVEGVTGARDVAAGYAFACALLVDGTVSCWGSNEAGQLGRGDFDGGDPSPRSVPGLNGVVALSLAGEHACALLDGGQVRCWGENGHGELGDGTGDSRPAPVPVCNTGTSQAGCLPLGNVVEVSVGWGHACARVKKGSGFEVKCWGQNANGELGPNRPYSDPVPLAVPGLPTNIDHVVATGRDTCILFASQAWCWGANHTNNDFFLLARGVGLDAGESTEDAAPVCASLDAGSCVPLTGVASIGLGNEHGCALIGDHVECWGNNYLDPLASAAGESTELPVLSDRGDELLGGKPLLTSGVEQLSVGVSHSCARLKNASAVCWGADVAGQLGNNDPGSWNAATDPRRPIW